MSKAYYSNCIIEAIKAKLKYRKEVKLLHVKSNSGLHHFLWHDLTDNNIYDFEQLETVRYWRGLLWFKGRIRIRPYSVYERWLKTKQW